MSAAQLMQCIPPIAACKVWCEPSAFSSRAKTASLIMADTLNLPNVGRSMLYFWHKREAAVNIGQAAKASGISAKMIRYYESMGLVPLAGRTDGGYRDYDAADLHRLRFIRRARDLGFAFDQVRELLKLWSDQKRSSADVRALALAHIGELEDRARQLNEMISSLRHLVDMCEGDHRPDCPIIAELGAPNTCCLPSRSD
jgi:MerR family copper efflux transcriptional regulator